MIITFTIQLLSSLLPLSLLFISLSLHSLSILPYHCYYHLTLIIIIIGILIVAFTITINTTHKKKPYTQHYHIHHQDHPPWTRSLGFLLTLPDAGPRRGRCRGRGGSRRGWRIPARRSTGSAGAGLPSRPRGAAARAASPAAAAWTRGKGQREAKRLHKRKRNNRMWVCSRAHTHTNTHTHTENFDEIILFFLDTEYMPIPKLIPPKRLNYNTIFQMKTGYLFQWSFVIQFRNMRDPIHYSSPGFLTGSGDLRFCSFLLQCHSECLRLNLCNTSTGYAK